jgi:hypothetical protein
MPSAPDVELWSEADELHSAVYSGDRARLQHLLAQSSASASNTLVNACLPDTGDTLLHVAARGGDAAVVEVLLQFGADAGARTGGCSPAVTAAAHGHQLVAARLERATSETERRARVLSRRRPRRRWCSLWHFWRVFSADWGITVAPFVWVANSCFAAYAYWTRLAPWAQGSLPHRAATDALLIALYTACWALWIACITAKPRPPSVRAKAAYAMCIKALATDEADPELERWISHAHAAALGPSDAICPVTGSFVSGFDHHCSFVGAPVGHHNACPFLAFCLLLTAACAIYTCLAAPQWRHITRAMAADLVLEAALLDMALGTVAVGQLALWQTRLAGSGRTAHQLKVFGRRGNSLTWSWAEWRSFWRRAQHAETSDGGAAPAGPPICSVEQLHKFLQGHPTGTMSDYRAAHCVC